jgi:hypothetical protein
LVDDAGDGALSEPALEAEVEKKVAKNKKPFKITKRQRLDDSDSDTALAEVINKTKKQASSPAKKSKKGATSTTANTSSKSALAIRKMPRITVNRMTLNLDDEVLKMIAGFTYQPSKTCAFCGEFNKFQDHYIGSIHTNNTRAAITTGTIYLHIESRKKKCLVFVQNLYGEMYPIPESKKCNY